MQRKTLCLATRNKHKVHELRLLLGDAFDVKPVSDYPGLPEIEETGTTFLANAQLKAEGISRLIPDDVLADDSGLEVDALNGAPGVWSARYAGLPSNDGANNAKLLVELEKLGAVEADQRRARFRCTLVLASKGVMAGYYTGTCEGIILPTPRGSHGFGYDPLFEPLGYKQSLAELGDHIKSKISHRAEAMREFAWAYMKE